MRVGLAARRIRKLAVTALLRSAIVGGRKVGGSTGHEVRIGCHPARLYPFCDHWLRQRGVCTRLTREHGHRNYPLHLFFGVSFPEAGLHHAAPPRD